MPYNEGPTLDMINEPSPETTFVKDPNTFDLAAMYDRKTINPISTQMGDVNKSFIR